MRYHILSLVMTAILFGWPLNILADEIFLKNGQVLKGRIVKQTPDDLTLEVCYGNITMKKNDISSVNERPLKENYLLLADGYKARGDNSKAIEYYSLALKIDPDYNEAKKVLEQVKTQEGQFQDSKNKKEEEILRLNEMALQEIGKKNYPLSLKYLQEAYRLDQKNRLIKDNLAQVYLNYSWQFFKSKDKSAARELLREGEKILPEYKELPILLGEFYLQTGDYDESIKIWEEVLKTSPDNQHLQSRLEEAYRRKGEKPFNIYYENHLFRFKTSGDLDRESRELLEKLVRFFREAGENLGSELFYFPPEIKEVIVYCQDKDSPLIQEGMFYNGKETIVSLPVLKNVSEEEIIKRVIYTSTQIFLYSLMGDNCPFWLREGFALYRSGRTYDIKLLREALDKKNFLKLREVEDFLKGERTGPQKDKVLAECLSLIDYIIESFGEKNLYGAFKEIASGKDYEEALETYFAVSYPQLVYEWIEWLKEK